MDRRSFLRHAAIASLLPADRVLAAPPTARARVVVVKTDDRAAGVARAVDLLGLDGFGGAEVFLKANYNSSDSTPGSTHPDVLAALLAALRRKGAGPVTLGERSGMGETRSVLRTRGALEIATRFGARVLVLDELPADGWQAVRPRSSHWQHGFAVPRALLAAGAVVQTCCLKTHRFGGHFTLSLKNSVGLAAKTIPGDAHDYMRELHGSPDQRRMIAEINTAYAPALVLLDGIDAFVSGGPDRGELAHPGVIVAGVDRVAVDAVGVALLRSLGTTPEVRRGAIFAQEQLARAIELGLGVGRPEAVELVTGDPASAEAARVVRRLLDQPPGAAG
ncbi:MAG TPA: DUF362 domain-containing protein [Myxococcaceae bacterium]|nr:DUF362 domain-containing protein [Myxococcaceae bacterium]